MSLIINLPQGPLRPVLEALDENEILHGYIRQLEDSATHQLARLQKESATVVDSSGTYYEVYHGLDGTTWHLTSLFSDYFPALQRASAFLALWGSFERHIRELCREVAENAALALKLDDLSGRGLLRMRTYLVKVANLDGVWAGERWQEFPDLQRLRNLFAHNDGHLEAPQGPFTSYVRSSPHLRVEDDVVQLEPSFLPHLLKRQRHLLYGLEQVVTERFGHDA